MVADRKNEGAERTSGRGGERKNWLEWTLLSIGVAVMLVVVGYLLYEITSSTDDDPELILRTGAPVEQNGIWYLPIELENRGGSVAADATVEVCTPAGECADLTFQFVPRKSTRTGRLGFSREPGDSIISRVRSYRHP